MVVSTASTTASTADTSSTSRSNGNSHAILPKKRHHNDSVILKNQNLTANTTTTTTTTIPTTNVDTVGVATSSPQVQPITVDGTRPQKRFYRQRAHCNPLAHNDSYDYPITPASMDWNSTSNLYPVVSNNNNQQQQQQLLQQQPTVLDIGCGFGGLTLALASLLPQQNICGIEIRAKVTEYVRLRILAARLEKSYCINPHAIEHTIPPPPTCTTGSSTTNSTSTDTIRSSESTATTTKISLPAIPISSIVSQSQSSSTIPLTQELPPPKEHHYNNCAVLRTNSMKYIPNYFLPHTMTKLFFCFPDPHFKRKNFPRRIISYRLLDEYAYILQRKESTSLSSQRSTALTRPPPAPVEEHHPNFLGENGSSGKLYAITDVKELHEWHVQACQSHPLFEPLLIRPSTTSNSNDNNNNDDTTNNNKDCDDDTDPFIYAMKYLTEEGQKVDRNHGSKYYIIFQCRHLSNIEEEDPVEVHAGNFFLNNK